jgi:hypothetical protein
MRITVIDITAIPPQLLVGHVSVFVVKYLFSTPGLTTRHNWPLRRDLRKLHRLYGSNFKVSPHQITPVILLFDALIAHSNYTVTGFKNLVMLDLGYV